MKTKAGNLRCGAPMHIFALQSALVIDKPSILRFFLFFTVHSLTDVLLVAPEHTPYIHHLIEDRKWSFFFTPLPPSLMPPELWALAPPIAFEKNVWRPCSYFVCTMHSWRLFIYVNLSFDQSLVTPLCSPWVKEATCEAAVRGPEFLGKFTVN